MCSAQLHAWAHALQWMPGVARDAYPQHVQTYCRWIIECNTQHVRPWAWLGGWPPRAWG